jgi:hypothetical protein
MKSRLWIACLAILIACLCCSAIEARELNERMAAWGQTMVATDEQKPNSCVSTYVMERFTYMDSYALVKLMPGIEVNGQVHPPSEAKAVSVEDFPGGVEAKFDLAGVHVTTRIIPLTIGREATGQEGAAVYEVSTDPKTPVVVRCGGAAVTSLSDSPRIAYLRKDALGSDGDSAAIDGAVGVLGSKLHKLGVAVRTSGALSVGKGDGGGQVLSVRFEDGSGRILVGFAGEMDRAKQIAALDPADGIREASQYYDKLLQCRVQTPEKVIDHGFRSAIYNLEYNWLPPVGWVECIHHWLALWHMQDTAAAEWIGQPDRSRLCNVTTADHLLPDGSVPQFMPNRMTKKDFGGSNQFFAWQVRHYWEFTGDRATIAKLADTLDKVIAQTFEQYDTDGDGLLSWGQQIGNQEDYVATPFNGTSPSVEGINMLRTGAMIARALGQTEKALAYEQRANLAVARLRSELWQSDLGSCAYYKDPSGVARLDGQYHTQIYPVIWGILDPLDSWTSIRHLRDRMTGKDGETFCSNDFPEHIGGTWGMQTGEAQQPWAAWGLAAVGLRNEVYRPLAAAARWAMNPDHRGAWPEIATEPIPAYFAAPAGLFIQSTVEALFGLRVHKPEGYLEIAPCFPDKWPSAKLDLPDYHAAYTKDGKGVSYSVASSAPLARRLRWMLPPCRIRQVTVNGKRASFDLAPGVDCVILSVNTQPSTRTIFRVDFAPLDCHIDAPGSVAEGDELKVTASGCAIERVDDRCGVLASTGQLSGAALTARVRTGILAPYEGFGRLGQMNFSRRTLFVLARAPGGVTFWKAIDLAVLPRYECAGVGEVGPAGAQLLVRNNTFKPLRGESVLMAARSQFRFTVDVPARAERQYTVSVPTNMLALFSPGANRATVVLPGAGQVDVNLVAAKFFESEAKLKDYAASRIAHVTLPADKLVSDQQWRDARVNHSYMHPPWAWQKPPMETLAGKTEVSVPGLPAVTFKLEDRKYAVTSWKSGQPSLTVDMGSLQCKKVYLLVIPFLDNHDTYSVVGRVDVRAEDGTLISRTLRFPGDIDWWSPSEVVWGFATAHEPRKDRFGLLPLLNAKDGDWPEGKPPAFPQPEYWATSLPLKTPSSVMNVIEMDLPRTMTLKSVSLSVIGSDPAFGLVAVSAETLDSSRYLTRSNSRGGGDPLEGTQWMLPPRFREPKVLWTFDRLGDLLGWRTEGDAFSVASVPSLFTETSLNSLAKPGESATGKAISPDFAIGPDDTSLVFRMQGGNSLGDDGPGSLTIRLVDSNTGQILERMQVVGSHTLRDGRMPVDKWRGKTVHLELNDQSTAASFAWLGVRQVVLTAQ